MKKNNFLQSIKMIAMILLIGLSISYIVWAASTPPPPDDNFGWVSGADPVPTNNGDDVINVGNLDQDKPAGLSVNQFYANGPATFWQEVKADYLADSNASSDNRPVCVDREGTVSLCP